MATRRTRIVPFHVTGIVLEKAGERFVLWRDDLLAEADIEGSATQASVSRLLELVVQMTNAGVRHPDELTAALDDHGYVVRGEKRLTFMSGALFHYAEILHRQWWKAWDERCKIEERHGGSRPELPYEDLRRWRALTSEARAAAVASHVVGLASAEALVNEILWYRFPSEYEALEVKRQSSFSKKLSRLCELLEISPNVEWVGQLAKEVAWRNQLVHHKPHHVHVETPGEPIALGKIGRPDVFGLVHWLDRAFDAIFGAFGLKRPGPSLYRGGQRADRWFAGDY